jgi:hypothetical protein
VHLAACDRLPSRRVFLVGGVTDLEARVVVTRTVVERGGAAVGVVAGVSAGVVVVATGTVGVGTVASGAVTVAVETGTDDVVDGAGSGDVVVAGAVVVGAGEAVVVAVVPPEVSRPSTQRNP